MAPDGAGRALRTSSASLDATCAPPWLMTGVHAWFRPGSHTAVTLRGAGSTVTRAPLPPSPIVQSPLPTDAGAGAVTGDALLAQADRVDRADRTTANSPISPGRGPREIRSGRVRRVRRRGRVGVVAAPSLHPPATVPASPGYPSTSSR